MPIRMVDDPQDPNEFNENSGGGRGGGNRGGMGGGGLLALIPMLFRLLGTKFGLIVLVIGAAAYFFLGQNGCGGGMMENISQFALGGELDPQQFAKAKVYEGLA